eukprot:10589226-Prorocentrum_lima.AAC.1
MRPGAMRIVQAPLLGKADGGLRPTGLMAGLFRVYIEAPTGSPRLGERLVPPAGSAWTFLGVTPL